MQVSEIREKYPQYNSLSDQQLVGAMHKKYYPDMDIAEFSQRVGYQPPVTEEEGFSPINMLANIPESAGRLIGDVTTAVMQPVDTAEAVGNLALGGLDKGAEALTEALPPDVVSTVNKFNNYLVDIGLPLERLPDNFEDMTFENSQYADAMVGALTERYGSFDAFTKTLEEDPVGVVSDIAGVLTGGGTLVPKVGGKISSLGRAIDPLTALPKGVAKAVATAPLIRNMPEKLYQSSAKFSTTKSPKERSAMTQTALENELLPRTSGVDKAREIIGTYNDKIDDLVETATKEGGKIKRSTLYKNLKQVRKELGGVNLDAPDDLARINKIVSKFEKYLSKSDKEFLTPREVQNLKQNIYKTISYKKKQLKGSRAGELTRKSIARSAKEELEKIIPEIKSLNAKQGAMLELVEALEKSASRIENRNIIGIDVPLKATAGAVASGATGLLAGLTFGILDTPTVKAKLAIVLKKVQEMDITPARKAVIAGQIAKLAGRSEQLAEDEETN